MNEVVEALEKYHGLVPLVYDIETMSLDEARPEDMQTAVYLKREADRVIAHHKYKRCLAMARWCHNESLWWYSKGYGFEKYDKFWEKWEKRWLEIAEQFKDKEEAK